MEEQRNPVSVLNEYCAKEKYELPKFTEQKVDPEGHLPRFSFIVEVNGTTYGPSLAKNKKEAKAAAAVIACDEFDLYHTGAPKAKAEKAVASSSSGGKLPPSRNCISQLFEYAQLRQWPKPKDKLISEEGDPHSRIFAIQYKIAEREFPIGSGRSKDVAKRRAAARALCELKDEKMRDYLRGPDPERAFGDQVAEVVWEAYGILCEELGETPDFCVSSDLAAFVLENTEDGSLRVLSIASGNSVAERNWRAYEGETIIDSHALVIARRCLLLFFYDQLIKLLECDTSVFEYGNGAIAQLKGQYEVHLYTRYPPCGDAFNERCKNKKFGPDVKNDHLKFFNTNDVLSGYMRSKHDAHDIASCSDKLLLWNVCGVQGALLSNFMPNIYINSITASHLFDTNRLTRAFCCRLNSPEVRHPWIQLGSVEGIESNQHLLYMDRYRKNWSIYWTHAKIDLNEEVDSYIATAGIIDGATGTHAMGTDRQGQIPPHCKRNLFILYKKLCMASGAHFTEQRSYLDHKNRCIKYRQNKNRFFKVVDEQRLGRFPIMERAVDQFWLRDEVPAGQEPTVETQQ